MKWTLWWGRFGPAASRHVTCESCGQQFACEVSLGGCWCRDVRLSDEARLHIREQFRNCLCRDCLERFERDAGRSANAMQ